MDILTTLPKNKFLGYEYSIITNIVKCNSCGDILESKNDDIKFCSCHSTGISGGYKSLKRFGMNYVDLSEMENSYIPENIRKKALKDALKKYRDNFDEGTEEVEIESLEYNDIDRTDNFIEIFLGKNEVPDYFEGYYLYLLKDYLWKSKEWYYNVIYNLFYYPFYNYNKDLYMKCFNLFDDKILISRDVFNSMFNYDEEKFDIINSERVINNIKYFVDNIRKDFFQLSKDDGKEKIIFVIKKDPISIFNISDNLKFDDEILKTFIDINNDNNLVSFIFAIYLKMYASKEILEKEIVKEVMKKLNICVDLYSMRFELTIPFSSSLDESNIMSNTTEFRKIRIEEIASDELLF